MEGQELEKRLMAAMMAAKTGKTEAELRDFADRALPALEAYENTLQEDEDYDEDDAFEAVFLALTENHDEKCAETALLLPVLMDALNELANA